MCYEFNWKIMLLGDETSGKTSLAIHYLSDIFPEDNNKLIIGVDFYTTMTNYNGHRCLLQIWVFGGEERFRFLLHQYCKGANGALFLYNITNPSSLDHLPEWIHLIRDNVGNIPIMLVGTEAHLEEQRVVTREQGFQVARTHNLSGFIEVSSKTGQNVERLFETMTEILINRLLTKSNETE